ncbi:MAG: hypothetical protein SWH78_18085 [Thermodesulfobacteriota bacterium]|nr:hypothetical protein [Thermodesulfobacteriota bacterium]
MGKVSESIYSSVRNREDVMDLSKELIRIAKQTENDTDRTVLLSAAVRLGEYPKPELEKTVSIPGYGYINLKKY